MRIIVNDVSIFYEKTGHGNPVILLHGNSETHHIFDKLVPKLARNHTVYALDSRCHGESQETKQLNYHDMAEDVAAFIQALHLHNVTLYGFSDGGIVAIMVAFRYPHLLAQLVASGANLNPDGLEFHFKASLKIGYFFSKKETIKLMLTQPNITKEDLSKITVPTIITAGQHDVVKRRHTAKIAEGIMHSQLIILKNENHGSYVVNSDKLLKILS